MDRLDYRLPHRAEDRRIARDAVDVGVWGRGGRYSKSVVVLGPRNEVESYSAAAEAPAG